MKVCFVITILERRARHFIKIFIFVKKINCLVHLELKNLILFCALFDL